MRGEGRPAESDTGKLDDRAVVRYLLGYKYEGGYQVWIPKLGVQETRDVVFYEGEAPMTPVDSGTIESRRGGSKLRGAASTFRFTRSTEVEHDKDDVPEAMRRNQREPVGGVVRRRDCRSKKTTC